MISSVVAHWPGAYERPGAHAPGPGREGLAKGGAHGLDLVRRRARDPSCPWPRSGAPCGRRAAGSSPPVAPRRGRRGTRRRSATSSRGRPGAQLVVDRLASPLRVRRQRRGRVAAVTDQLRRDALADLARRIRERREREVRVGMEVDEARCDGEAARVDHAAIAVDREARRDGDDRAVLDTDVEPGADGAGAVEDEAAANQDAGAPPGRAASGRGNVPGAMHIGASAVGRPTARCPGPRMLTAASRRTRGRRPRSSAGRRSTRAAAPSPRR